MKKGKKENKSRDEIGINGKQWFVNKLLIFLRKKL